MASARETLWERRNGRKRMLALSSGKYMVCSEETRTYCAMVRGLVSTVRMFTFVCMKSGLKRFLL